MAYKKLIKVSNVCQLLDKSKYRPSKTINGVTFTNNGDGSFTIDGTASANAIFNIQNIGINRIKSGAIIYLNTPNYRIIKNNILFEYSSYSPSNGWCYFFIPKGAVVENLVAKPQLFYLTEMYGAGHEPTTIEQFRQDFPEELYDYSPNCWLTSYKRVFMTGGGNYLTSYQRNLTCKTKNLLPYPYFETTITRNGVTFTDNRDGTITANGTSTSFATFVFSKNYNFIAGNTYYVSTPYSIIAYKENGTIYYIAGNKSFTWSSNWEVVQIYVQINKGITLNNLKIYPMINLGDTATDYVPYGHL